MKARSARQTLLVIALMLTLPTLLEGQSGRVFSAVGDWWIAGETDRPARPNNPLEADEAVVPPADRFAGDRLVLWFEVGRVACSSLSDGRVDCFDGAGEVCLSGAAREPTARFGVEACLTDRAQGRAGRFLASVFRIVGDDLGRYMPLLSRGPGAGASEDVLLWQRGSIDVEPLLANLPSGRYRICLNRMTGAPSMGIAACAGRWSRVFEWEGTHGRIPYSVEPGLYELTIDGVFGPSSAWVLFADSSAYAGFAEEFRLVREETRGWVDADPAEIRTSHRAWLEHLARR